MSNQYFSNAVSINKRLNPIPQSVPVTYESTNRANKFRVNPTYTKRFVSETYIPGDRNASVPSTASPIMMEQGINEVDRYREQNRTHVKLEEYVKKIENLLPTQGPAVLPLSGVGGSPFKLAMRTNSVNIQNTISDFNNIDLTKFRANQFKETLSLNQRQGDVKKIYKLKPLAFDPT